ASQGVVTAEDLFDFLADRVGRWALANREASQNPVLLPSGPVGRERARGILLLHNDSRTPSCLPAPKPVEVPVMVGEEWQGRDRLLRQFPGPFLRSLHAWKAYEARLIRFEELALDGAPGGPTAALKRQLAEDRQAIEQLGRFALASRGNSLAM